MRWQPGQALPDVHPQRRQRPQSCETSPLTSCASTFYNAVRLHSALGNLSPIAFEHQSAIKKPTEVSEKT